MKVEQVKPEASRPDIVITLTAAEADDIYKQLLHGLPFGTRVCGQVANRLSALGCRPR